MKIKIQPVFFGTGLLLFYLATIADLSIKYHGFFSIIKYIAIVGIACALLIVPAKKSTNVIAFIGVSFFCLMTMFFTLFNLEDTNNIVVAFGYWVCAAIYFFSSRNSKNIILITNNSLIFTGILFLIANVFYINDSSAYSISKNQFFGLVSNANALAGLTGMFFVVFFAEFIHATDKVWKLTFIFALAMCGFFLFLAGSRGAILAIFIAVLHLIFKTKNSKKIILLSFTLIFALFFAYIAINTNFSGSNRDFFEESGRVELYERYLDKFSDTYLLIGTGVSQEAGRLKSELSYLDILLFSGVGSLGFFIFLIVSLKQAFLVKSENLLWASALFIYIAIISIFEGYAANIASIPSLLFYLLPGIIYYSNSLSMQISFGSVR